jgi:hypothetical protein
LKKYYEAYDERYKIVHQKGIRWFGKKESSILKRTIKKYQITKKHSILEIGCGEGRDAFYLLKKGYSVLATDISNEAIQYCKKNFLKYQNQFQILNCLHDTLNHQYDFIYAIAVIHMFVLDEDRDSFYMFVKKHLNENGLALICSLGDGIYESKSNIQEAFELQKRNYKRKTMMLPATSCRIINWENFKKEILKNQLQIIENGIISMTPLFNKMMYVIVKK